MATAEADLDLGGEATKKKGGMKSLLIMAGGGLVLVGASVGLSMFLMGGDKAAEKPAAGEHAAPKKATAPAAYTPLDPPFVVNFEDDGAIRFLQVSVDVMSRDPAVGEAVKLHMPAIRDQLIILFSSSDYATLSSREGKETLRAEALTTLKALLKAQHAPTDVDGLYFTNFVMQ
ncbi:flagellar basal body-associated protein FliL [Immundisolibacter sp.]|uniref:flagellar basal body-associated FliL family protein n=1 Tax=Immundisolibacter sp. TaxID=1934948 RepID=UPI0035692C97